MQFLIKAYDGPGMLEKRMEVRPRHLEGMSRLSEHIICAGGLLVKNGSLSAPDFITVIILSVGVITPIITMMSYSDDFRTMGTIFGEVRAILEAPEMEHPAEGKAPEKNDLSLRDVRFCYKDAEVLHGVSMDIPEGSFVALVGPSGSGKSTIAQQGTHETLMAREGIYRDFIGERREAASWKVKKYKNP